MSGAAAGPPTIDAYLDEVADRLADGGARLRRTLAEAEDHLRSTADQVAEDGSDAAAAERMAIERFGAVEDFVAHVRAARPWPQVLAATGLSLARFAGLGMVAVGCSGLVAELLGRAVGAAFVAGDPPGVTYTPARCAQYLALTPRAGSCTAAAVADHFAEAVQFPVVFGLLGALVLLGMRWLGRRRTARLPDSVTDTAGALLYGVAAAVLLGQSADLAIVGGSRAGPGAALSQGTVALIVAALYTRRLLPGLRARMA